MKFSKFIQKNVKGKLRHAPHFCITYLYYILSVTRGQYTFTHISLRFVRLSYNYIIVRARV